MRLNELKKYSHTGQGYASPGLYRKGEQWRGPHEKRELKMMLDNVKPAAIVGPDEYQKFKPYVKKGRFIAVPWEIPGYKGYIEYIVGQPGEEYRINKIRKLLNSGSQYRISNKLDVYSAKLGRLLGYTKEHIRKFIEQ